MFRAKIRITMAIILVTMLFAGPLGMQAAVAEEEELWVPPPFPGIVSGVGTFFQLTDSAYLNVSLQTTELVTVMLSSAPSVVEISIEAADGALATEATLSGLAPNTTYYKYDNDLENLVVFTTGEDGVYAWSQDLLEPHVIFLQLVPSTKYIRDTTTGGDCTAIGTWVSETKTCTLTTDVYDTIQIANNNITLDGAGHIVSGFDLPGILRANGVFIPKPNGSAVLSGITIKNLTIQGFNNGIGLATKANSNTIVNNTIQGVNRGISLETQTTGNTIAGNTILDFNNAGVYLFNAGGNFIRGNSIVGDHPVGIWVQKGSNNQITGNRIIGPDVGIQLDTDINKVIRNTVNDAIAPLDGNGFRNSTYNNNFLGYQSAFQNSKNNNQPVNTGSPLFGNFWHGYDTDLEGCYDINLDLICDAPYQLLNQNSELAGVDNFPWKKPNGWHPIQITAPVAPQLIGTPIVASATFSDLDSFTLGKHTAVWDWGDGTTSTGTVSESLDDDGKVVGEVSAPVHDYPLNAGIYELKLKISESYYMSYVEKVFQYIVIYDPSAGFVTGGGYFDSPVGAYAYDLELTGQATFGFISKYKKGATVPEGQTVFEFHAGDLYFKSFTYDFLVLAGGKATFKGTGTINDIPGYSFFITAIDGEYAVDDGVKYDYDTFRIRIWETETGYWIYDNQMGAPIDTDSTTRLIEGSIIIQVASTVKGK